MKATHIFRIATTLSFLFYNKITSKEFLYFTTITMQDFITYETPVSLQTHKFVRSPWCITDCRKLKMMR